MCYPPVALHLEVRPRPIGIFIMSSKKTKAELKQQVDKLPCVCDVGWMVMLKQSEMRLNSELMKSSVSCSS